MRTATCFLLICISLLHLMVLVNTEGTLESIVEQKVKELLSHQDVCAPIATKTLSCTSIQASGRLATCPSGMVVTGCACGYGCGSWDIRNENTCHCQCAVMDWAAARCCKLS